VKSLSSVVSASRVVASGFMEGRVALSAAREIEMLCDRRNSIRCDSKAQENSHISKVGGRKESI
jgi:hypothetical protein